jgi:hypothetical protein
LIAIAGQVSLLYPTLKYISFNPHTKRNGNGTYDRYHVIFEKK